MGAAWVQLRAKPTRRSSKPAGATALERDFQRAAVKWLRIVLNPAIVASTGTEQRGRGRTAEERMRFGAALKATGVVAGFFDAVALLPGGVTVWFEFKRPGTGVLRVTQQEVHQRARALGHIVIVGDTIEALRHGLRAAGIPLRESAAEPAAPARVRLAKPRAAFPADRVLL